MQTKNPSIIALSTASAVSVTGLAFISPIILLIKDHYNVSSNEVQLTIEELKSWLTWLNLGFLGFVNLSETTKCNFSQKFGKQANLLDLNQWEKYEDQFPNTFVTMYQFWCQDMS